MDVMTALSSKKEIDHSLPWIMLESKKYSTKMISNEIREALQKVCTSKNTGQTRLS
jgi:hypothetical protein